MNWDFDVTRAMTGSEFDLAAIVLKFGAHPNDVFFLSASEHYDVAIL